MSKSKPKSKLKKFFSVRNILSLITLALLAYVIYAARDEILQAFNYLGSTNLWFILLLIPEQILMYYCVGQMFFSYLKAKQDTEKEKSLVKAETREARERIVKRYEKKRISTWELIRVSFELNFVNHAIPSGGVAGLGYISWRLKKFGSSVGQTSFMYLLRYGITILANQVQVLIAVLALLIFGLVPTDGMWVVGLALLVSFGIVFALVAVIIIASKKARIDKFADFATKFLDKLVQIVTFGHKKKALDYEKIQKYFYDLHANLVIAKRNKKILIKPILWGLLYSFLEVATYWLVGMSMGHPDVLLQFMVAEAIASAIGAVMFTPG